MRRPQLPSGNRRTTEEGSREGFGEPKLALNTSFSVIWPSEEGQKEIKAIGSLSAEISIFKKIEKMTKFQFFEKLIIDRPTDRLNRIRVFDQANFKLLKKILQLKNSK